MHLRSAQASHVVTTFLLALAMSIPSAPGIATTEDWEAPLPTATWDDTDLSGEPDGEAQVACSSGNNGPDCSFTLRAPLDVGGTSTMMDRLRLTFDTVHFNRPAPLSDFDLIQPVISAETNDDAIIVVTPQQLNLRSQTTGKNIELIFQDYGNTPDDDMNHAFLSVDCTTTTSDSEDCYMQIAVTEDGGEPCPGCSGWPTRPDPRITIAGDGGITLGSKSTDPKQRNNFLEVTTDGTGDGEVILPARSIGSSETSVLTQSFEFCGEGPAASSTVFLKPPNHRAIHSLGLDYSLGSADCDALDLNVEADADGRVFYGPVEAVGLACYITGAPSGGNLTFALRNNQTTISSVACQVASGSSSTWCDVASGTAPTITDGSPITIAVTNGGTTSLVTKDILCTLFVTR